MTIVKEFALEKEIVEKIIALAKSEDYDSEAAVIAIAIGNLFERHKALVEKSASGEFEGQLPAWDDSMLGQAAKFGFRQELKSGDNQIIYNTKDESKSKAKVVNLTEAVRQINKFSKSPEMQKHFEKTNELLPEEGPERFPFELDFDKLDKICSNTHSEKLRAEHVVPSQGEIYGYGSEGLIWQFHNRMLCVKVVLWIIAGIIIKKESQYVDFKDVKEEIEMAIENFTEAVDSIGIDCKTGFPANVKSARELPRMKKYKNRSKKLKEEKINLIVRTSRDRFVDQYFGRTLRNVDGDERPRLAGACFEMGLLAATMDKQITLTKKGLKFVKMQNTILELLEYDDPIVDEITRERIESLSEQEVDFIIDEIISQPKFGLEKILVKKLLGSSENLMVEHIVLMLEKEQLKYMKKVLKENLDLDEDENKDLKENLNKYRRTRAISTALRLAEMGLLEKKSVPRPKQVPLTAYFVTSAGKEVSERLK